MTSSKQRRLSNIFTSPFPSKEEVPEVPALPKSAGLPRTPTSASDLQSDPFRKLSLAQKRLKSLSTFFQSNSTKSTEDISQKPPSRPAPSRPRSTSTTSPGKLQKPNSPPIASREADSSPKGISSNEVRGRQSLVPPPPFDGLGNPRSVSSPAPTQRPATSHHTSGNSTTVIRASPPKEAEGKLQKTRWGKSRKSAVDVQPNQPRAWVIAGQEKIAYNIELLEKADKV